MITMAVWLQATRKVEKKIAEIGRKEVNKHDIYIKFECHPYKITLPKIQPGIDS